jgi:hypothetical protein
VKSRFKPPRSLLKRIARSTLLTGALSLPTVLLATENRDLCVNLLDPWPLNQSPQVYEPQDTTDLESVLKQFARNRLPDLDEPRSRALFLHYLKTFFQSRSSFSNQASETHLRQIQDTLNQYPWLAKPLLPQVEVQFSEEKNNSARHSLAQGKHFELRRRLKKQFEERRLFQKRMTAPLEHEDFWFGLKTKNGEKLITRDDFSRIFSPFLIKKVSERNFFELSGSKILLRQLEKLIESKEKQGINVRKLRQIQLDILHYSELYPFDFFKDFDDLEAQLRKYPNWKNTILSGLNDRDNSARRFGFQSIEDARKKWNLIAPTGVENPKTVTEELKAYLESLETISLAFTEEELSGKSGGTYLVRPLSLIESPFRSCLGEGDCSSRSYFLKALDPNYLYFTWENLSSGISSGHATVVLGKATDSTGQTHSIAFLDKLMFVDEKGTPNLTHLPYFLEGVKKALLSLDYSLMIPTNLGSAVTGMSNFQPILDFIQEKWLTHHPQPQYLNFKPNPHAYSSDSGYTRALQDHSGVLAELINFGLDSKKVTFKVTSTYAPKNANIQNSFLPDTKDALKELSEYDLINLIQTYRKVGAEIRAPEFFNFLLLHLKKKHGRTDGSEKLRSEITFFFLENRPQLIPLLILMTDQEEFTRNFKSWMSRPHSLEIFQAKIKNFSSLFRHHPELASEVRWQDFELMAFSKMLASPNTFLPNLRQTILLNYFENTIELKSLGYHNLETRPSDLSQWVSSMWELSKGLEHQNQIRGKIIQALKALSNVEPRSTPEVIQILTKFLSPSLTAEWVIQKPQFKNSIQHLKSDQNRSALLFSLDQLKKVLPKNERSPIQALQLAFLNIPLRPQTHFFNSIEVTATPLSQSKLLITDRTASKTSTEKFDLKTGTSGEKITVLLSDHLDTSSRMETLGSFDQKGTLSKKKTTLWSFLPDNDYQRRLHRCKGANKFQPLPGRKEFLLADPESGCFILFHGPNLKIIRYGSLSGDSPQSAPKQKLYGKLTPVESDPLYSGGSIFGLENAWYSYYRNGHDGDLGHTLWITHQEKRRSKTLHLHHTSTNTDIYRVSSPDFKNFLVTYLDKKTKTKTTILQTSERKSESDSKTLRGETIGHYFDPTQNRSLVVQKEEHKRIAIHTFFEDDHESTAQRNTHSVIYLDGNLQAKLDDHSNELILFDSETKEIKKQSSSQKLSSVGFLSLNHMSRLLEPENDLSDPKLNWELISVSASGNKGILRISPLETSFGSLVYFDLNQNEYRELKLMNSVDYHAVKKVQWLHDWFILTLQSREGDSSSDTFLFQTP